MSKSHENDLPTRYDEPKSPLGKVTTRAVKFLFPRRVSQERARAYDERDARQDIYIAHLMEGTETPSDAVASRAIKRESKRKPKVVSLNQPIRGKEGWIGELGDITPAEENDLERVEDQDEAQSIVERLRKSPYGSMVDSFAEDLDKDQAVGATQRQRKHRLKQAFPEEARLIGSRFGKKNARSKK